MFTGLIEEVGAIYKIDKGEDRIRVTIKAIKLFDDLKIGDSISVNGVCLTVTDFTKNVFTADVMAETVRKSSMKHLNIGDKVNLERALRLSDRLGGHIVSGHTDGVGIIVKRYPEANAIWIEIKVAQELIKYMIHKGSIALDGISLTIAALTKDSLKVSIIPHTGSETTLLNKEVGNEINIECDMYGKYVERFMEFNEIPKKEININFLKENGFA